MDPVTAGLQALASLNNLLGILFAKASTPQIDALIEEHLEHRRRLQAFVDFVAFKVLHFPLPVPPSSNNPIILPSSPIQK